MRGPEVYLQRYASYFYLLDSSAAQSLKAFMMTEPEPFLKDFAAKIQAYDELRQEIFLFRNKVRMLYRRSFKFVFLYM